ncbi:MAG: diguanylate cyclase [Candidatus Omnitrophota bacterium]
MIESRKPQKIQREAERPFQNLLESLKSGVYMADVLGNLIFINQAYVEIMGYKSKKEVLGLNLAQELYSNPNDRELFLGEIMKKGFVKDYEVVNKRKDGREIILSVTSNLVKNITGRIIGTEGVIRDITQQKQAEEAIRRISEFNQTLINTIPFGMEIVDQEGKILFLCEKLKKIYGKKAIGKRCWDLYKDDKAQCLLCPLRKNIKIGEVASIETEDVLGGRTFLVTHTGMLYEGKNAVLEIFQDITERKEIESRLKVLQEDLEFERKKMEQVLNIDQKISSILELNQLVDFVIEKATQILEAQKCSLMLVDDDSQELLIKGAKGLKKKIIKETRIKVGDPIAGIVAQKGEPLLVNDIESELLIARKNRSSYKGKSFLCVPIKLHAKLVGVVNVSDKDSKEDPIFTEVDLKILCSIVRQAAIAIENAYYYRELEFLSTTDSLTSLFNHRQFIKTLQQEIERSRRYPRPLCLLMIDIDGFKEYNDQYGHPEGDILLSRASQMMKRSMRNVDILCRYAGDEFAAILPETDIPQAKLVAEKVKKSIEGLNLRRKITISIGAARYAGQMDRHDFVMKADQSLYQAKREGKNRICCFD